MSGDYTCTFCTSAGVGAWGQLSKPKVPDFAGRETFEGTQFHSAEWDHAVDNAAGGAEGLTETL